MANAEGAYRQEYREFPSIGFFSMAEFLLQHIRRRKLLEYLGKREDVVVSPFASKDQCSAVCGGGVLVVLLNYLHILCRAPPTLSPNNSHCYTDAAGATRVAAAGDAGFV